MEPSEKTTVGKSQTETPTAKTPQKKTQKRKTPLGKSPKSSTSTSSSSSEEIITTRTKKEKRTPKKELPKFVALLGHRPKEPCGGFGLPSVLLMMLPGVVLGALLGWLIVAATYRQPLCGLQKIGAWSIWSQCESTCESHNRTRRREISFAFDTDDQCSEADRLPDVDSQRCATGICCKDYGYEGVAMAGRGEAAPRCYHVVSTGVTFDDAASGWTVPLNYELFVASSAAENEFVRRLTESLKERPWIGIMCHRRYGCRSVLRQPLVYMRMKAGWQGEIAILNADTYWPAYLNKDGTASLDLSRNGRRRPFVVQSPLLKSTRNCRQESPLAAEDPTTRSGHYCYKRQNSNALKSFKAHNDTTGAAVFLTLYELMWFVEQISPKVRITNPRNQREQWLRLGLKCKVANTEQISFDCDWPDGTAADWLKDYGLQAALSNYAIEKHPPLRNTVCLAIDVGLEARLETLFHVVSCGPSDKILLEYYPYCPKIDRYPYVHEDMSGMHGRIGATIVTVSVCSNAKTSAPCKGSAGPECERLQVLNPHWRDAKALLSTYVKVPLLPPSQRGHNTRTEKWQHGTTVMYHHQASSCPQPTVIKEKMDEHSAECSWWTCCVDDWRRWLSPTYLVFPFCYRLVTRATPMWQRGQYGDAHMHGKNEHSHIRLAPADEHSGGRLLATVHGDDEHRHLINIAKRQNPSASLIRIGLVCRTTAVDGCWWTDGSAVDWKNFADGHPDGRLLSCVAMDRDQDYKWVSTACLYPKESFPHMYELYRHCDKITIPHGELVKSKLYFVHEKAGSNPATKKWRCIDTDYCQTTYWNCGSGTEAEPDDCYPSDCILTNNGATTDSYFYYARRDPYQVEGALTGEFNAGLFGDNADVRGFLDVRTSVCTTVHHLTTVVRFYADIQHYWLPFECKYLASKTYTVNGTVKSGSVLCRYTSLERQKPINVSDCVQNSLSHLHKCNATKDADYFPCAAIIDLGQTKTALLRIGEKPSDESNQIYTVAGYITRKRLGKNHKTEKTITDNFSALKSDPKYMCIKPD